MEIRSVDLREPGEIERAMVTEQEANGGVIVTVSPLSTVNRDRIIALAARNKVPAVYPPRAGLPTPSLGRYFHLRKWIASLLCSTSIADFAAAA